MSLKNDDNGTDKRNKKKYSVFTRNQVPQSEDSRSRTPAEAPPRFTEANANGEEGTPQRPILGRKRDKRRVGNAKESNRPSPANELLPSTRPRNPIGDFFYSFGFFAEAWVIRVLRILRDIAIFVGHMFVWLFGGLFSSFLSFSWNVLKDLFAPIGGFFMGIVRIFQVSKGADTKNERTKNMTVSQYMMYGTKKYGLILKNLLRIIFPLGAAVVLVITMFSVFNRRYALEVIVNDKHIGYVENELVIEEAQQILRGRLKLADNQSLDAWSFTPKVAITTSNSLSNQTQLADEILVSSPNEIVKGKGLYIGGVLYGATEDAEELENYLDGLLEAEKAEYENSFIEDQDGDAASFESAIPTFIRNIKVGTSEEIFLAESIQSIENLVEKMNYNVSESLNYTSDGKQSLKVIIEMYNITFEQLIARNPDLDGRTNSYVPPEGTVLLVLREEPFLQVQLAVREMLLEDISFEIERSVNSEKPTGYNNVLQAGEKGQREVYYDTIYIDQELVQKEMVETLSRVIKDPKTQIIEVGGKVISVISGGGALIWPLPTVAYSTRGFAGAHQGLDLNDAFGATIYAAASGTVTSAGYHGTLGYHVVIDHGDGLTTVYAHSTELYVVAGDSVAAGQPISSVGSTGRSSGPHLHFEVRQDGIAMNPLMYVVSPITLNYS